MPKIPATSTVQNLTTVFILIAVSLLAAAQPHDREMVKKGFLKGLGLQEVPSFNLNARVPDHFWQIYEEGYDVKAIRHYYPRRTVETNSTSLLLEYNLKASDRNSQSEHVIRADLKLLLDNVQNGQELSVYSYFPEKRLIDTKIVENSTDWLDFDVTDVISEDVDMVTLGVETTTSISLKEQPSTMSLLSQAKTFSAPLIVYSDHSEPEHVRRKRSTEGRRKLKKKKKKHQKFETASNLCHKAPLYVDFYDLNWQDWIMAPRGYEAGQCLGECPHPMPSHLNATNHAIIQALMHSINPQFVPSPCCVPTETSSLSILLMDVENVITIKEYTDMRVESCGCR